MNLIMYAVPVFFLLIGIELIAERVRGTNYYRLNDSLTSLATGTLSHMLKVVQLIVPFTIYLMVYQQFAWFELGSSLWVWVVAFILYDFCYYWLHRFGHEIWILWAAHVVHHSSEEYNLTTALRQTGTSVLSFAFYLPMALLGFPPEVVITVGSLNLIYQYWVHTRHIGKLGWAEKVFITPSNHRGHHAQNSVYIDRNYGGVFIIWDRLFGSYQEELDDDPPVFGIRGALASWNPLWANIQIYKLLWEDCKRTKNWWYKLTIWFRRTGWRPPDVAAEYPFNKADLSDFKKFDIELRRDEKIYAAAQHVLTTSVSLFLLLNLSNLAVPIQFSIIAWVLFASFIVGGILERKVIAYWLELPKYAIIIGMSIVIASDLLMLLSCTFSLISLVLMVIRMKQQQYQIHNKRFQ